MCANARSVGSPWPRGRALARIPAVAPFRAAPSRRISQVGTERKASFDPLRMTHSTSPQILVVGAGAIGAFFGAVLARQGAFVSVVARSDYEAIRARGFQIRSPLLGTTSFQPTAVYRSAAEAPAPDYLILSTKVLPH